MTIPTLIDETTTNESAEGVLEICGLCTLPMRHPYIVDGYLGNNASPLQGAGPGEGRCCDVCDCMYVLPARMEGRPPEAIRAVRDMELISRYAKILLATQDWAGTKGRIERRELIPVTGRTRVPRDGSGRIVVPLCGNEVRVYHLSWSAMGCGCGESHEKAEYFVVNPDYGDIMTMADDWVRLYMLTQERLEPAKVPEYVVKMNRYARTGSILGGDE